MHAGIDRFGPLGIDPRIYRKEQGTEFLGILFSKLSRFSANLNDHYDLPVQP